MEVEQRDIKRAPNEVGNPERPQGSQTGIKVDDQLHGNSPTSEAENALVKGPNMASSESEREKSKEDVALLVKAACSRWRSTAEMVHSLSLHRWKEIQAWC